MSLIHQRRSLRNIHKHYMVPTETQVARPSFCCYSGQAPWGEFPYNTRLLRDVIHSLRLCVCCLSQGLAGVKKLLLSTAVEACGDSRLEILFEM